MDWKEYERQIEQEFRQAYPHAQIRYDAKVVGKFSKVERQIDLLIEDQASDFSFRIVVDAKHRGRKIDVNDIEAFIGLARDVEAHTALMIALEGYSEAAVNRAHNDDLDIILDVLNFDELRQWQGLAAVPYSGDRGVSIAAPFGWIVDATQRPGMVATLYQRGRTFEEAVECKEFMYVNFWNKRNDEINTLDRLLEHQKTYMLASDPEAEIAVIEESLNHRVGTKTLIRRFKKKTYPTPEFTGFVDFEQFICMCVLFTPESLERKNLRKLRFILRDAFPLKVHHDHTAEIKAAEDELQKSVSIEEKSQILARMGFWSREMGDLLASKRLLQESLSLEPNHYYTLNQLRATLIEIGDKKAMLEGIRQLLRIDPHNPTVFSDSLAYMRSGVVECADTLALFEELQRDYPEDRLVQANCDFYSGQLLIATDSVKARKHFLRALALFRRLFPRRHEVFSALKSGLKQLPRNKRPRQDR